jgi:glycosyltransferase involved in cell wall biosynthesis
VPQDRFVVAAGAVSLLDHRKGGHLLRRVMASLGRDAHFLLFGHAPSDLGDAQATGFVRDFRRMPLVYSAADVFLGTSLEEAFGQTLSEASACGVPIVAFRAGGVPEVARDGLNARLVDPPDADGLVREVQGLRRDPEARQALGRAGRSLVEAEFTLEKQVERWTRFLDAWPRQ